MSKWLWVVPILAVLVVVSVLLYFGWGLATIAIITAAVIILAAIFAILRAVWSLRLRLYTSDSLTKRRST